MNVIPMPSPGPGRIRVGGLASEPTSHVLDRGQTRIRTASCSVLTRWQPIKLTHLVGSCFEVYKDFPRAFWLY